MFCIFFIVVHLFEVPCGCLTFTKTTAVLLHKPIASTGSLAEWSKALVLGTSPKGRGFESHSCQKLFFFEILPLLFFHLKSLVD